jgi:hypothetical protein
MDMGMQMHPAMAMPMEMPGHPAMAMPTPAMPVSAVQAQMSHVPMGAPFMHGVGSAMPEGFHAPPMGLPHDLAGHEALGQHEANPFMMGGGPMPGMPAAGLPPGMGMPHGMAPMGMPHQVMGAHPAMGGPPQAGFAGAELAYLSREVMGAHPAMGGPPVAGFAGFGGFNGAQPMGAHGFGGMQSMPMQHGMPMPGAGYGGYGMGMPPGALPPVGGSGA